jgi:hypothetical protein
LYVAVTLFHTGGEANHHPAIFAAYAESATWTAVHLAQFACMATMLAGLFALFSAADGGSATARLAGRLGVTSTTAALALYGIVLAVDGVALKPVTLGLAVLLAASVIRTAPIPRAITYVMALSGLTYVAQGWLAGAEGFSPAHTLAIVLAEVLNAAWMTWLLVVAWRPDILRGNASTRPVLPVCVNTWSNC